MATFTPYKMVNVVALGTLIEEIANMSKSIVSVLIVLLLGACASGGGSGALVSAPQPQTAPPSTNTDPRHSFDTWTESYTVDLAGHSSTVTHTFDMTEHTTSGLPAPTEKYKIADYGFFRSTITGYHDGYEAGEESSVMNSYLQRGDIQRADLNGDGWQDFYLVMWAGDHNELDWAPTSYVFAFLNDGDGNFILSNELFPEGNPCFAGTECTNTTTHNKGVLVADFNGDGLDDIYNGSNFVLSNNGKFYNHTDRIPTELSQACGDAFCFTHDAYTSDVEGDGDLDIFLPISQPDLNHVEVPWTMLMNDGTGNFSINQNFPDVTDSIFATTAVIGDFDNDGSGDVAVGWFKPGQNSAFSQTYENSAGAVFWNDGQNDWSVRPWSELPDNYYGSNGNANDMEVIDFNNDGLLDIVLASTKHDPYYDGRMIQFFVNNGDGTFGDVTGTYNTNTKYANGLSNGFWNGDGQLHIIDFDADGDLDIVDSVRGSYVLLNENGSFSLYDDFPRFNDNNKYYPIEIDNKYWYDFIGSTNSYSDTESVATFFQVLDPPLHTEICSIETNECKPANPFKEMMQDIVTKPQGYANGIFESKILFTDLRKNLRHTSVFGAETNDLGMLGFSKRTDTVGFALGKLIGNNNGSFVSLDYLNEKNHFGINYVDNTITLDNPTKWYGTGQADVDYTSLSVFFERVEYFNDNWYMTYGGELYSTKVDSFKEDGSNYDVHIQGYNTLEGKVFADINGVFKSSFGITLLSVGVDYFETLENTNIRFADMLNYDFNRNMTLGKVSVLHRYNSFYAKASFDTQRYNTFEIGYVFKF